MSTRPANSLQRELLPPTMSNSVLLQFIDKPETCRQSFIILRMPPRESSDPSKKIRTSSAKLRWVIKGAWQDGWRVKVFSIAHISRNLDETSIISTKRSEEMGSPCLNPFPPSKYPARSPLIVTLYDEVMMHSLIHSMKTRGSSIASSMSSKKPQWTLSYAFDKSTFKQPRVCHLVVKVCNQLWS